MILGVGFFPVQYTLLDTNRCLWTSGVQFSVYNTKPLSFSGLLPSYCLGDNPTTLVGNDPNGIFSGIELTITNVIDPNQSGVGNFTITYWPTMQTSHLQMGCSLSFTTNYPPNFREFK